MLKWGVLGYGNIAKRMIQSLQKSKNGELYAIASKSQYRQLKGQYPTLQIYNSYDALLDDENVDVVYIALPHGEHFHFAKKALNNGIAVLCEKPATLSYQHICELVKLSQDKQVFFMEAMKTRFIPLIDVLKEELDKGVIGHIQSIETSFCNHVPFNRKSYLFDEAQGGALYDVGIYGIAMIQDLLHAKLKSVKGYAKYNHKVDVDDEITMTFTSGQTGHIHISLEDAKEKIMTITGDKGTITVAPFYRPEQAFVKTNKGHYSLEKPYVVDDFYGEIEAVHTCLKNHLIESPQMPHSDSCQCILWMEKIKESFHEN